MSFFITTVGLLLTVFFLIYFHFKRSYRYWKNLNIKEPCTPSIPFGHFSGVSSKKNLGLLAADIYNATKNEKFVGVYFFKMPALIINDLDLVKTILIKDFNYFHDRGFDIDPKKEPLTEHLVIMNGQAWRNLRVQLTPTFTSGKMKMMFPTMIEVGHQLEQVLEDSTKKDEVEIKDILARYATDVIASCAFGIENNSLQDPNNEFRKMGREMGKPTLKQIVGGILFFIMPNVIKKLPITFTPKHITEFFISIVRDTMNYREKNNVTRSDFMQLLLQLKNFGFVKSADKVEKDDINTSGLQKFTFEQAAAQCFLFFFAGFETTSATMLFALYELALDPGLQGRVQVEIDDVKAQNGGQITYDGLQQMNLLDRIISETLRKYVPGTMIVRECTQPYNIPETTITLEKGTKIWMPIFGYHRDPNYYPDPEKFDPDRFLPGEKDKRPQFSYLPFGDGPRNCIGSRFGLMQVKTGLAIFLSGFNVAPSKNTPINMVFDPKIDTLTPKGLMHLKISKRVI